VQLDGRLAGGVAAQEARGACSPHQLARTAQVQDAQVELAASLCCTLSCHYLNIYGHKVHFDAHGLGTADSIRGKDLLTCSVFFLFLLLCHRKRSICRVILELLVYLRLV
jgi:hypothetical protein